MSAGGGKSRITFELTADEADAVAGFLKVSQAVKKTERDIGKMGRKGEKAGQDLEKGMKATRKQLISVAARFAGLGAAIGVATGALADFNAERERQAELGKENLLTNRKLVQLAGGDVGRFRELQATQQFLQASGLFTKEQAAQATFSLASTGQEDARDVFARLAIAVDNVVPIIDTTAKALTTFGKGIGDQRQIVNALASATEAEIATIDQVAVQLARTAPGLQALNTSFDETLAVTGRLISLSASPEQGGTQAAALANFLLRPDVKKTGRGSLADIEQFRGLSGEQLRERIPESEAFKAVRNLLADTKGVAERTNIIRTQRLAQEGQGALAGFGRVGGLAFGPEIQFSQSLAALEIAKTQQAGEALRSETLANSIRAAGIGRGDSFVRRELTARVGSGLFGVRQTLGETDRTEGFVAERQAAALDALNLNTEAIQALTATTETRAGANRPLNVTTNGG